MSSASKPDAWCIVSGEYVLADTFATFEEALTGLCKAEARFPHLSFHVAPASWCGEELLIEPSVPATERASPHQSYR